MSAVPSQFDLLSRALDITALRHQVLAHNVANVNTPGYRRLSVNFEDALKEHIEKGGAKADLSRTELAKIEPTIIEHGSRYFRADQNNVDVGAEMGRLNKNTLLHNAYVQILTNKIAQMRTAITQGGG